MKQPDLGKKIAEIRKRKLLTQEELVAKCEINIRTLQRIEAGEVTPRAYTLKAILKAMDYSAPEFLELNVTKKPSISVISSWLSSWYSEITNLFNFKFNTMKKNLIFLLSLFVVVFLVYYLKPQSAENTSNPLLGIWKLVEVTYESNNDSIHETSTHPVSDNKTRLIQFRKNSHFETRNLNNSVYNSGLYALISDTAFVTVHFVDNVNLSNVSNMYDFKINNDTLHFRGLYMSNVSGDNYRGIMIDEAWVKIKN